MKLRVNRYGEYGTTLVASADRTEVHEFDSQGRHIRTLHAITGEMLRELEYDTSGRLIAVEDADANRTELTRDSAGKVTQIEAPFGQVTSLDYDGNDYLAEVDADPANPPYMFEYTAAGLMTEQVDPRGHTHIYGYDALGRVNHDEDPASGFFDFAVTTAPGSRTVTRTSAQGRVTTYGWLRNADGTDLYTVTLPTGHANTMSIMPSGISTTTMIDGTVITRTPQPDPNFRDGCADHRRDDDGAVTSIRDWS
jgi:YD repeat-containing protein